MKVDMSARAVTARLKRVSQLRRLCLALGKSKPVPTDAASRTRERTDGFSSAAGEADEQVTGSNIGGSAIRG